MWHPWRTLRETFPHWEVRWVDMPAGYDASTDHDEKLIWMDRRLNQAERRWTVTHEMIHIERGHDGTCNDKIECSVDREAARRLIPIEALVMAALWSRTLREMACELWVPAHAVVTRMDSLHPAERAYLHRRVANRDNEDQCERS
jgi:Zn-dependent peptidase ImmA (M78 family)